MSNTLDWTLAVRLDELAQIGVSRSTLHDGAERASTRLRRWSEQIELGESVALNAWSTVTGLDVADVKLLLGSDRQRLMATQEVPEWAKLLMRITEAYSTTSFDPRIDTLDSRFNLCSVAWPWLRWSRQNLQSALTTSLSASCDSLSLLSSLQKSLLFGCAELLERTIVMELSAARERGQLLGDSPSDRFSSFCLRLSEESNGLAFWQEYISLARILTEYCQLWLKNSMCLLSRFAEDGEALKRNNLIPLSANMLQTIEPLGDSHSGGARVSLLTFSDGHKLIYKPRTVISECLLGDLLDYLGREGFSRPFIHGPILDCQTHGWFAYHEHKFAETDIALSHYYHRCGGILALADCIGIRDLSYDNVIACNDMPYIVDAECALWPLPVPGTREFIWYSTLISCGLLPGLQLSNGVDLSALGSKGGEHPTFSVASVTGWNTDAMAITRTAAIFEAHRHRPSTKDDAFANNVCHVVEGFIEAYDILWRSPDQLRTLLSDNSIQIAVMKYLPRPSAIYAKVLHEMLHPNLLRDALDGEALLAKLYQSRLWDGALFPQERVALWKRDIPLFYSRPNSRDLHFSDGGSIPDAFSQDGLARANQHLYRSNRDAYISNAIRVINQTARITKPKDMFSDFPTMKGNHSQFCLELADAIGRHIRRNAWNDNGRLVFIDVTEDASTKISSQVKLEVLGGDLYWGLAGLLVFFSYLAKATGDKEHTKTAQALFRQVAELALHDVGTRRNSSLADDRAIVGGYHGPSSLLYGLLHAVPFGDKETVLKIYSLLLDQAIHIVRKDKRLDWIMGTAGLSAILHAAGAFFQIPESNILQECGRHIIRSAIENERGLAWVTHDTQPLTGLGHGAGGLALALSRLWTATGDQSFLDAARAAIRWENQHYVPSTGNWRDLRTSVNSDKGEQFAFGWCAGAPGIGLARSPLLNTPLASDIGSDIDSAYSSTASVLSCLTTDGLCHGTFGCLEALFSMAWATHDPWQHATAQLHLDQILERIVVSGFRFASGGAHPKAFMLGLSGIGYSLLRVAADGAIPSILLLEPVDSDHKHFGGRAYAI
jgi:class II lanthipeptide synthase